MDGATQVDTDFRWFRRFLVSDKRIFMIHRKFNSNLWGLQLKFTEELSELPDLEFL